MRITEERYVRDMRRLTVAMRLIRHEARTSTIRECTGLTDDRIRRLYHAYIRRAPGACRRHRGSRPRYVWRLMATPRLATEAAIFAGISGVSGVDGSCATPRGSFFTLSLTTAERLCDAFELHHQTVPQARLSFEQALCVARALWVGDEIAPARCAACGSLILIDRLKITVPRCFACSGR